MKTYSKERDNVSLNRSCEIVRRWAVFMTAFAVSFCSLAVGFVAGEVPAGDAPRLPGMCHGRSDANVLVNAHGRAPKFILNIATDGNGLPDGVLVFGQGPGRLYADIFCRVWQHLPGQEAGGNCASGLPEPGEIVPEGAVIVHVVGLGRLRDGTEVVVRADARETEEGRFFRVRYRALRDGHDAEGASVQPGNDEEDDCEDGGWIRYPLEGWARLDQLKVRQAIN